MAGFREWYTVVCKTMFSDYYISIYYEYYITPMHNAQCTLRTIYWLNFWTSIIIIILSIQLIPTNLSMLHTHVVFVMITSFGLFTNTLSQYNSTNTQYSFQFKLKSLYKWAFGSRNKSSFCFVLVFSCF